ncbi:MAG: hypothetical protein EHM70_03550 [Chloroflexota bacterium]|nr:MAG: hypothetical protein EHM70_03550 [Chloroflexota bacterium]
MPAEKPSALSPYTDAILAALQWQGARNDCGPFTVATVLNGLRNLRIEAVELARAMDKPVWRGPFPVVRRIPEWATFPWGIASVLRENGLRARWHFFGSRKLLRQSLDRGDVIMPVIGSWKPLWAHVMTMLAWDAGKKCWGFANTQTMDHTMYWLDDKTFTSQWRAMGNLLIEIKASDIIQL